MRHSNKQIESEGGQTERETKSERENGREREGKREREILIKVIFFKSVSWRFEPTTPA